MPEARSWFGYQSHPYCLSIRLDCCISSIIDFAFSRSEFESILIQMNDPVYQALHESYGKERQLAPGPARLQMLLFRQLDRQATSRMAHCRQRWMTRTYVYSQLQCA